MQDPAEGTDAAAEYDSTSLLELPDSIAYTTAAGKRGVYRLDQAEQDSRAICENPRGFRSQYSLFSTASSAETASNLVGPGRILGNLLEVAGRRVERNIGILAFKTRLHPAVKAEQRLKKWNPGNEEETLFLLTCAASVHQTLQQCAFRLLIDFVLHHKTWRCLNRYHSLEEYHTVMAFIKNEMNSDPELSISQWKRKPYNYSETWNLHYKAARFLWDSESKDVDTWINKQVEKLRNANVGWTAQYQPFERLLVYIVASCSCTEPDAWITLPYSHFIIAINQTHFGPTCRDKEGVDLFACAVMTRMLRDFSEKLEAMHDDKYAVENFFHLVKNIRRFNKLFPIASQMLQNASQEICGVFDHAPDSSESLEKPLRKKKEIQPLVGRPFLRKHYLFSGKKWTLRPWSAADEEAERQSDA